MGCCKESMQWLKCYFDQIMGKTVKKEDAWDSVPILAPPPPPSIVLSPWVIHKHLGLQFLHHLPYSWVKLPGHSLSCYMISQFNVLLLTVLYLKCLPPTSLHN